MVLPEKGAVAKATVVTIEPELPVREAVTQVAVPAAPPAIEKLPLTSFEMVLALVSLALGFAGRLLFRGRTRSRNAPEMER